MLTMLNELELELGIEQGRDWGWSQSEDEVEYLERVNAQLRANLRQLAEASLLALPEDDRRTVLVRFAYLLPQDDTPF